MAFATESQKIEHKNPLGIGLGLPDMTGLAEDERSQILAVLQRAKEFETSEEKKLMRQPLEGLLYKYTNVMKGWQYRWFVLEPESGRLEYFEKEEYKSQRPRGSVHLAGAVISPSDEDSQTFTVHAANGEIYRLKASDARERQHWVNRLRATAEYHTDTIAQNNPPIPRESRTHSVVHHTALVNSRQTGGSQDSLQSFTSSLKKGKQSSTYSSQNTDPERSPVSSAIVVTRRSQHKSAVTPQTTDSFRSVKEMISQVQNHQNTLAHNIEELPPTGEHLGALDKDMLMLKATSNATLQCLEQCLNMLQQQQAAANQTTSLPYGSTIEWLNPQPKAISAPVSPAESYVSASSVPPDKSSEALVVNHNEEVEDENEYSDTDLGGVEEHKSIILHLLSQLKLGMDLTKVVLPTFILEKRSLLEMFADCMAHPDLFLRITDLPDAESRMLGLLEWYLTSFHSGRKGSIAKKPYNPIIGERFHCSWSVPTSDSKTDCDLGKEAAVNGATEGHEGHSEARLCYSAEQVSHHPPVSAFYFECPEKQMCMNASIWTKSKFMGMSIGVVMVGKLCLNLLEHDEVYEFSLPSAYARSILTIPWVELGDRVVLSCLTSGYSAAVTFHTKPFYGGKLHKVSAEVKNPNGEITWRVGGEWNGILEFTRENETEISKVIDTAELITNRKRVRPLNLQADFESRKLWLQVTEALKKGDIDTATQHKRFLEERQRQGERHRKETNTQFPTRLFHKAEEDWIYNHLLKKQLVA